MSVSAIVASVAGVLAVGLIGYLIGWLNGFKERGQLCAKFHGS